MSIRCLAELCNALAPSDAARRRGRPHVCVKHISVLSLLATYCLHVLIVTCAYVRTKLDHSIVWSAVRYTIRDGRIWRMERQDAAGRWYSRGKEETLEPALDKAARQAVCRLSAGGATTSTSR